MKNPLDDGPFLVLDEVESTQTVVADALRTGEPVGAVLALHQTRGRGRFDREWISEPGASLNLSLAMAAYSDHGEPWLVGMAVAVAVAGALHSELRWPNDLVLQGSKLGGILVEIVEDSRGRRVPVVGIGVNLNQTTFPEPLAKIATSLALHREGPFVPEEVARAILGRFAETPEPESWQSLEAIWGLFDDTPGKHYRLTDGREAVALGIGPHGELLCSVAGESMTVLAADAIFG
ncbi:MAG: biotin--[acetyl-CoA-carboxylase] ligase [Fimbriimonadaceae bacterium]|nr:biotin--[acetyl-CoA-carboxylase] ligase [Chthonomonadaceae bacterium]MCO5296826.1 biotin--[acetyl-CoA-carboxylase] ligase [Fimbriimonadaceae bacterium]